MALWLLRTVRMAEQGPGRRAMAMIDPPAFRSQGMTRCRRRAGPALIPSSLSNGAKWDYPLGEMGRNGTTARMNGWGPLYFPFGWVALAKHILEWLGVPVANSDDLCGAKGGVPVMSPSPGLKKVGQRYLLDFPVIVQSPGPKKMNRRHLLDF